MEQRKNAKMTKLKNLSVGEYFYFEAETSKKAVQLTGYLAATKRYPKGMEDFRFKTNVITGIPSKFGECIYLVRAERIL